MQLHFQPRKVLARCYSCHDCFEFCDARLHCEPSLLNKENSTDVFNMVNATWAIIFCRLQIVTNFRPYPVLSPPSTWIKKSRLFDQATDKRRKITYWIKPRA
jgi:hypothetical protein